MKQLYDTIKEKFLFEKIDLINIEIINESIKAPIIKELAKQLLDLRNQEKKEKENDSYKSIYNQTFKSIFGNYQIAWDEIDDKDIKVIDAQTWNETKLKNENEKLIRSIIKGNTEGIIICRDPETKDFDYVILNWGNCYHLKKHGYRGYSGERTGYSCGRSYKDLNQREKINLFNNKTLYFIDTTQLKINYHKKRKERYDAKNGMIDLDPYSLSRIAHDNIERYKKIISQNKANNVNNDTLLNEANEIIKKISDITIQVAKDPLSYADILYKVGVLSKYIYDERRYVAGRTPKQQGYYTGYNGLIPLIGKYIKSIKDSKDGYSWGTKNIDSTTNAIKDSIKKCKDILKEIEELL